MHFSVRDFRKEFIKKKITIKIRCKINSPCTCNKRSINVCTLRPLFETGRVTILQINTNLFFSAKNHCVQNSEGFINYNLSHGNHSVYRWLTTMTAS